MILHQLQWKISGEIGANGFRLGEILKNHPWLLIPLKYGRYNGHFLSNELLFFFWLLITFFHMNYDNGNTQNRQLKKIEQFEFYLKQNMKIILVIIWTMMSDSFNKTCVLTNELQFDESIIFPSFNRKSRKIWIGFFIDHNRMCHICEINNKNVDDVFVCFPRIW